MAYIKVNIDRLRGFSGSVEDILKNTARISDDFMSIGRRLDWDILVNTRVQKDLDRLENQFGTERASLKKMAEFFSFAATTYVSMESQNRDDVPSEMEDAGDSGLEVFTAECLHGKQPDLKVVFKDEGITDAPAVEDVPEPVVVNTLGASFGGREQETAENEAVKKADTIIGLFSGVANWGAKMVNKVFGQVVSGVTGFTKLIWNTAKNAEDRVSDLEEIQTDETLTSDEKKYMFGVTEHLSNVEAAFDALGWVTGMIPFVGGTLSKMFSAIGDGIDSDGIKSEILEETRDIENAKKQLEEANTFFGKLGALANLGTEYLESGYDITSQMFNEVINTVDREVIKPVVDGFNDAVDFVEDAWDATTDFVEDAWDATTDFVEDAWDATTDFVEDAWDATTDFVEDAWDATTDFVDNTIVQPIKDVGNAIGNGVSWLGNKLGLW